MPDWFQVSYLGFVIFLTLTGIGLPIPEEVAIVAAGVASKAGALAWYKALAACLVGALLGEPLHRLRIVHVGALDDAAADRLGGPGQRGMADLASPPCRTGRLGNDGQHLVTGGKQRPE